MVSWAILSSLLEDLCDEEKVQRYLQKIAKEEVTLDSGLFAAFPELRQADVTSVAVFEDKQIEAEIIAREKGVLSGLKVVKSVFTILDPGIKLSCLLADGEQVSLDQTVAKLSGSLYPILAGERMALNFLCHLSGVATCTSLFVEQVRETSAKIFDTRKTIPGLRLFEKQAVMHGGGTNHRLGLWDMILLKNNHIDAMGGIKPAVEKARNKWGKKYAIEVETRTLDEVREAISCSVDRIMFDNMTLNQMREAVSIVGRKCETEASGNIHLSKVRLIAESGVDFISIGGDLTLSAPRLDFSLRVVESE